MWMCKVSLLNVCKKKYKKRDVYKRQILYRLGFSWDEGNPDSSLLYIEEHSWREYFIKTNLNGGYV